MHHRLSPLQDSARIVAVIALLADPVMAVTCYTSPGGSAAAAGTTRTAATTPANALSKVNGGDSVIFLEGVYTQTAFLTRSGTAGSPMTLRADAGTVPIFRGPGSGNGSGIGAIANIAHYVYRRFVVRELGRQRAEGIELPTAHDPRPPARSNRPRLCERAQAGHREGFPIGRGRSGARRRKRT
jgi:hypothetical protein